MEAAAARAARPNGHPLGKNGSVQAVQPNGQGLTPALPDAPLAGGEPHCLGKDGCARSPGRIKVEGAVDGSQEGLWQIRPHRLETRRAGLDCARCFQQ